ncbi:alpha/beta fold hydrolase [Xylophilus sp. Kf1]|nr:alpha/beta fold hydrolase [Xylophilus sp. Kf1]
MTDVYRPRHPSTRVFVPVRQCRLHLHRWGRPVAGQAPLVLLHGWMDVGASWQFMVDHLRAGREVLAPDWRGFGLTESPPVDHHAFDDYLGDLDALLEQVSPDAPVDLVGHSMGGNVAMLYAGARPGRVRRLVNLEGFGLADVPAEQAAARHGQWLDELAALRRGEKSLADYDSQDAVARRLMRNNPRLPVPQARWLAGEWAQPVTDADGTERWRIRGDAAHRVVSARVFRSDEVLAHYRAIACPLLAVHAAQGSLAGPGRSGLTLADFHRRLEQVRDRRVAEVADAGHMLHHDRPLEVAGLIEDFIGP